MKNCPLCNTPPMHDLLEGVYCINEKCGLFSVPINEDQWNHRPVEQQLTDALLAARGIIEEVNLLQLDKVIGQIDAVLQSITGDNP